MENRIPAISFGVRRLMISLVVVVISCGAVQNSDGQSRDKTEIGTIEGASYRIDVPRVWNKKLVVLCHGYLAVPEQFNAQSKADGQWLLSLGYAVAQSGYSSGGWAIREGLRDSELLKARFAREFGVPLQTLVIGYSLGGIVSTALMETKPNEYNGGIAFCSPLGSADWFMGRRVFDFRVMFDFYFPGIFPSPASTPIHYTPDQKLNETIMQSLMANAEKTNALMHFANVRKPEELSWLAIFFTEILSDLDDKASGNPFDNRNVVYESDGDLQILNNGVTRYKADAAAASFLHEYYTATGRLSSPLLAVRNTYDPLVPAWVSNAYLTTVEQAGSSQFLVGKLIDRPGHCAISDAEAARAFHELAEWVDHGQRPAPGLQW